MILSLLEEFWDLSLPFIGLTRNLKSYCMCLPKFINVTFGKSMTFGKLPFLRQLMKKWLYLPNKKERLVLKLCFVRRIWFSANWPLFATTWLC